MVFEGAAACGGCGTGDCGGTDVAGELPAGVVCGVCCGNSKTPASVGAGMCGRFVNQGRAWVNYGKAASGLRFFLRFVTDDTFDTFLRLLWGMTVRGRYGGCGCGGRRVFFRIGMGDAHDGVLSGNGLFSWRFLKTWAGWRENVTAVGCRVRSSCLPETGAGCRIEGRKG